MQRFILLAAVIFTPVQEAPTFDPYPACKVKRFIYPSHDGDTIWAEVWQQFGTISYIEIRPNGYNAAETNKGHKDIAEKEKQDFMGVLKNADEAWIKWTGKRSFTRYVCDLWVIQDGKATNIAVIMKAKGDDHPWGY